MEKLRLIGALFLGVSSLSMAMKKKKEWLYDNLPTKIIEKIIKHTEIADFTLSPKGCRYYPFTLKAIDESEHKALSHLPTKTFRTVARGMTVRNFFKHSKQTEISNYTTFVKELKLPFSSKSTYNQLIYTLGLLKKSNSETRRGFNSSIPFLKMYFDKDEKALEFFIPFEPTDASKKRKTKMLNEYKDEWNIYKENVQEIPNNLTSKKTVDFMEKLFSEQN